MSAAVALPTLGVHVGFSVTANTGAWTLGTSAFPIPEGAPPDNPDPEPARRSVLEVKATGAEQVDTATASANLVVELDEVNEGETLVAYIDVRGATTSTITPPTGFDELVAIEDSPSSVNKVAVYAKAGVSAGESTTQTATIQTDNGGGGSDVTGKMIMLRIEGLAGETLTDVIPSGQIGTPATNAGGSSANIVMPSVDVEDDLSLLLAFAVQVISDRTFTAPGGMTEIADYNHTTIPDGPLTAVDGTMAVFSESVDAGATGTRTAVCSVASTNVRGVLIALTPMAEGGEPPGEEWVLSDYQGILADMVGYAAHHGVTGGTELVVVTTAADFKTQAEAGGKWIVFDTDHDFTFSSDVEVAANTTIDGRDQYGDAVEINTFGRGIKVDNVANVILHNFAIKEVLTTDDGVQVNGSNSTFWGYRMTVGDPGYVVNDGLADAADNSKGTWQETAFIREATNPATPKAALVGNNQEGGSTTADQDTTWTFYRCLFDNNYSRTPWVAGGRADVVDCYVNLFGQFAVAAGRGGHVLIRGGVIRDNNGSTRAYSQEGSDPAVVRVEDVWLENCTGTEVDRESCFTPPYTLTPQSITTQDEADAFKADLSGVGRDLTLEGGTHSQPDEGQAAVEGGTVLGQPYIYVYTDIAGHLRSFTLERGKTRELDHYHAGTVSVTLDNRSRDYDPFNEGSPYWSSGGTGVRPGRPVYVTATHPTTGVEYLLFTGVIRNWGVQFTGAFDSIASFTASDVLTDLANIDIDMTTSAGDAGAVAAEVLVEAGITQFVSPAALATLQAAEFDGTALAALHTIEQSEQGALYVETDGEVVFASRGSLVSETRSRVSQATFGAGDLDFQLPQIAYESDLIRNEVKASRPGGEVQTETAQASVDAYGKRSMTLNVINSTDAEVRNIANYIIGRFAEPRPRVHQVTLTPQKNTSLMTQALSRRLRDRVTVTFDPVGDADPISQDVFITGIRHEIRPQSGMTTVFTFEGTEWSYGWLLGTDALGEAVLGY